MPDRRLLWITLLCLGACFSGHDSSKDWDSSGEEPVFPVRLASPSRAEVRDYVRTNQTLEADRRVDVRAEVDGTVLQRLKDRGDRVGEGTNGDDPLLLALLDDRELGFALEEAQVAEKQARGKLRELDLAVQVAREEHELAQVTAQETKTFLERAEQGIKDGTVSQSAYDRADFAHRVASEKIDTSAPAIERALVGLELGRVAIEAAQVAVKKAAYEKDKARIRSAQSGVVTYCGIRVGQRVSKGDRLYEVADPQSLVAFARIPVRDAVRIRPGNAVLVHSRTTGVRSTGKVLRVAPTVDPDAGTVVVKIAVEPVEGLSPGLYVAFRIVVGRRENATVVPKRAVLHDEDRGPYVFLIDEKEERRDITPGEERGDDIVIKEGLDKTDFVKHDGAQPVRVREKDDTVLMPKHLMRRDDKGAYVTVVERRARRASVVLGYEREEWIEVTEGLETTDRLVVEGQDTLTDRAKVEILPE